VIQPPLEEKTYYTPSDVICLNLILVARAIEYFSYFVFSFEKLGEIGIGKGKGKFRLEKVESIKDSKKTLIYHSDKGMANSDILISSFREIIEKADSLKNISWVRVRFLTPARIKHGGRFPSELPFHFLIQALLI